MNKSRLGLIGKHLLLYCNTRANEIDLLLPAVFRAEGWIWQIYMCLYIGICINTFLTCL
jgi:hypothetical protein